MEVKGGYWGKILRVNLIIKEVKVEFFFEEFLRKYFGGVGFGMRVFYEEVLKGVDLFGFENKMIIIFGFFVDIGIGIGLKIVFNFKSLFIGGYGRVMVGVEFGV